MSRIGPDVRFLTLAISSSLSSAIFQSASSWKCGTAPSARRSGPAGCRGRSHPGLGKRLAFTKKAGRCFIPAANMPPVCALDVQHALPESNLSLSPTRYLMAETDAGVHRLLHRGRGPQVGAAQDAAPSGAVDRRTLRAKWIEGCANENLNHPILRAPDCICPSVIS